METVVFVLMILVCFNFMLKQTYRKLRSVLVISVICALFVKGRRGLMLSSSPKPRLPTGWLILH